MRGANEGGPKTTVEGFFVDVSSGQSPKRKPLESGSVGGLLCVIKKSFDVCIVSFTLFVFCDL